MYKTLCLFIFVALTINLVHSWDFAITNGGQIEFFSNGIKNSTDRTGNSYLTALAYDAVNDMLLFVDKKNINVSIFSYNLATKQYKPLVRKRSNAINDREENIQGIAYDPIQRILFWTESTTKSIYWLSLEPKFQNSEYGNLFLNFDDRVPKALAVDSCRKYLYWTTINHSSIQRAKFDRLNTKPKAETIVTNDMFMPVAVTIDQSTRSLYWLDDKEGTHCSIERSDLQGGNRTAVSYSTDHEPNALTVSKDSLYWVDLRHKTVWRINKHNLHEVENIKGVYNFSEYDSFGIVANYTIEDQTSGVKECETLNDVTKHKPAISVTFDYNKIKNTLCLHGDEVKDEYTCKCAVGYSGERCQTYDCHNYCVYGNCSIGDNRGPQCRCNTGYTGIRCETKICNEYCMNDGACVVNEKNKPSCKCLDGFLGNRCETKKTVAPATVKIVSEKEECNCPKLTTARETNTVVASTEFITTETTSSTLRNDVINCTGGWDIVRDPILLVLGILCGLLCVACAALFCKVTQLKKRPRIKKRIIVNKNVTPLTARPDACEITIENCCNMNICETPCFEPRSTLRANLLDARPGKEEKKNLISNMEYPEDY